MKLYDLTAVFSEALPIYGGGGEPGLTRAEISLMARGDRCNVSQYTFGSHTGTHADMPKHFIDDGLTCDRMPPEHFFGPARVLDLRLALQGRKKVEAEDLTPYDIQAGEILLFNLGNTPLMHRPVFTRDYVSVGETAAALLADKKIKTVGVDYLSIEAAGSANNPVHTRLLGGGIAILEGLCFDGLIPQGRYTLSALPLKFIDGNGSPVRAVLADDFTLELVIFDMDGLLLDTEPVSHAAWREAARQMGFDFDEAFYRRIIGSNRASLKKHAEAHFGPGFDYERAYALRSAHVRQHRETHGIQIKKGAADMLDALDALGVKKCVATSTDFARAEEMLADVGIRQRFDFIIGGDHVQNGKPHPEIFLQAAAACGARPEGCLVLEDSEAGVEAGYRAGMRVIMVPDMYAPSANALARASAVCEDLRRAADWVATA